MARKLRELIEGASYHVYSKACGKQQIFIDDRDRSIFVDYLHRFEEKFGVSINCYALPDNHYHLHLQDKSSCLSDFMHSLNSAYATYFNRRHAHLGSVFNGRFKSKVIKSDHYFDNLFTYLAKNISKHGLSRKPLEYRWFYIKAEFESRLDQHEIQAAFNEKPRVKPLKILPYSGKISLNYQSIRQYAESSCNVPQKVLTRMQNAVNELNNSSTCFLNYYLRPPSVQSV